MPPDIPNSELFIVIGVSALTMLLLTTVVMMYVYRSQRRFFQQQLHLKEIENKYKEELLHNNIEILEEERKRIAKDLHDEIGSIFSTLRLKINQLEQDISEKIDTVIQDSRDIIDAGIQSVRRISHGIIPPGLEIFGLPDTLEDFVEKLSTGTQLKVMLECPAEYQRLSPSVELGIFRIVQELTNNTLRHAKATMIGIELQQTATQTRLIYSDNGKGFDLEETLQKSKNGLGLRNIDARASQIKGRIAWTTQPGMGLTVTVEIPLP